MGLGGLARGALRLNIPPRARRLAANTPPSIPHSLAPSLLLLPACLPCLLQLVVDKKSVFDLATREKSVALSIVPSGSAPAKVGGWRRWVVGWVAVGARSCCPALVPLPPQLPSHPHQHPPPQPQPPQVIAADIPACQALIHVIDAVLVPESKPDAKAALLAMFQH